MKARYIAFEGIDGSGKTNQLDKIAKYLKQQNYSVLVTKELGSSHNYTCTCLREFVLNNNYDIDDLAAQYLLAACSIQHSEKVLKPNLYKYDFILSDRSIESNLAYGAAASVDSNAIETIFFSDRRRIFPSEVIYLDITPEISWERIGKRKKEDFSEDGIDRIEQKGLELQSKVRKRYLERAEKLSKYKIIDASQSIEKVFLDIKKNLNI